MPPNPLPGCYVRVWLTPLGKALYWLGDAAMVVGWRRAALWLLDEMFGGRQSWYVRSQVRRIPDE